MSTTTAIEFKKKKLQFGLCYNASTLEKQFNRCYMRSHNQNSKHPFSRAFLNWTEIYEKLQPTTPRETIPSAILTKVTSNSIFKLAIITIGTPKVDTFNF